jgi:hypothetical protein
MDWNAMHLRLAQKQVNAQVLSCLRASADQSGRSTAYMSEASAEGHMRSRV